MTVEAWLSHWLDNIAAPSVRPKTLAGYRTAVRQHLIPRIGQHSTDRLQGHRVAQDAERQALLKAAGVRPARLHDARHTAATMLLVLKVPTRAVMEVMGWSQVSMTTRYQHVPAEILHDIADAVGGSLWTGHAEDVAHPEMQ